MCKQVECLVCCVCGTSIKANFRKTKVDYVIFILFRDPADIRKHTGVFKVASSATFSKPIKQQLYTSQNRQD